MDWSNNQNFIVACNRVLGTEGGYVKNPSDPGGETNWGISKRSYPNVDIKNLSRESAMNIYFQDFWTPLKVDSMQLAIAYQLFDFAVNSGIPKTIKTYQMVCGATPDGIWGPNSQASANKMSESDRLFLLLAARLEFMTNLSNWPNASRGWSRRIAQNLKFAATDTIG